MASSEDALQLGFSVPRPVSTRRWLFWCLACACFGLASVMLLQGVNDSDGGPAWNIAVNRTLAANAQMRADDPSESLCATRDTGGTCFLFGCHASRGPTECHSGHCMCKEGLCAIDGVCTVKFVPPASEPCGSTDTEGTCSAFPCHRWRGPTVCDNGACICQPGYCAKDGRCFLQGTDQHPLSQHRQTFSYVADMTTLKHRGGYVPAFCEKSTDGCRTADFPGENCRSEFQWKHVVEQLETVPGRQSKGDIVRGNDLGYFILNSGFWDRDVGTIALGLTVEEHSFVRPLLDKILGSQSSQWSVEKVRASVDAFLAGKRTLNVPSDVNEWSAKLLHQVHLGLHLSDEEAQDFANLQTSALSKIILPSWGWLSALEDKSVLALQDHRERWLNKYQIAISSDQRGVFPKGLGARDIFIIATSLLDSLLFAGGLSVPSLISVGLAVMHSTESPLGNGRRFLNDGDVKKLVWEVIRQMPAVVGFAWWNPGGDERSAMSLSMALRDPSVWGADSDTFKLRNLSVYEQFGPVAWAQPANGPGWRSGALRPMSRGCPGQALSFTMVHEFLSAWNDMQDEWYHPEGLLGTGKIRIGKSTPWISPFDLERK